MTRRRFIDTLGALVALVLFSFSETVSAAIPCGRDVPIEEDYLKQVVDYLNREYVDTYKSNGHRNPKWDDTVLEFFKVELEPDNTRMEKPVLQQQLARAKELIDL